MFRYVKNWRKEFFGLHKGPKQSESKLNIWDFQPQCWNQWVLSSTRHKLKRSRDQQAATWSLPLFPRARPLIEIQRLLLKNCERNGATYTVCNVSHCWSRKQKNEQQNVCLDTKTMELQLIWVQWKQSLSKVQAYGRKSHHKKVFERFHGKRPRGHPVSM